MDAPFVQSLQLRFHMEVLIMDLRLRKPRLGYKHEAKQRYQISKDEWFIIIWIRDGYALTAYEDAVGARYLSRKSKIKYNEDGVRYVQRDNKIYYLSDDLQ
jgi:hypothetical protein